ncbi:hypothetical protein QYF36_009432 [Acer negundo]|nr:hypothetical protein QYF36_009432 [Acer negundo]
MNCENPFALFHGSSFGLTRYALTKLEAVVVGNQPQVGAADIGGVGDLGLASKATIIRKPVGEEDRFVG